VEVKFQISKLICILVAREREFQKVINSESLIRVPKIINDILDALMRVTDWCTRDVPTELSETSYEFFPCSLQNKNEDEKCMPMSLLEKNDSVDNIEREKLRLMVASAIDNISLWVRYSLYFNSKIFAY